MHVRSNHTFKCLYEYLNKKVIVVICTYMYYFQKYLALSKFKLVIQIKSISNLGNCWSKSTWCSDTRGRHNFGGFCGQSWTRSDFYIKLKDSLDPNLSQAETIITVVWLFGKIDKLTTTYTIDCQWCYLKDPKSWVFLLHTSIIASKVSQIISIMKKKTLVFLLSSRQNVN